ncbi:L,D-transpeptidase, partial [Rhizobium ruizarguesonis]
MIKLMPGLAAAGLVLSLMSTSAFAAPAGSAPNNAQAPAQIVRVAQMQKYVKPQFKRKKVRLVTTEAAGTVIIDTNNKYLYLVEGNNRATRYGIGVGRDGFGWSGVVKIGRKAEWPAWTPPAEMRRREAAKGHMIPAFQEGGEDNPLGARAM